MPSAWFEPSTAIACASSGISSSSSVTTTRYSSNGYGPNSVSKNAIMRGTGARSCSTRASRGFGYAKTASVDPAGTRRSEYRPICTVAR
ncbi:hypothetical protein CMMCAS05_08655 [Clavibacter michiganensis subsp. michiganensis]|nr:hypothetical protein CMMCAS05_08655 [Clavibacter michiganensis subsp. michiganensis]